VEDVASVARFIEGWMAKQEVISTKGGGDREGVVKEDSLEGSQE
jgi:hypothetical protein